MEKRQYERSPIKVKINIESDSNSNIEVITDNISKSGIGFYTKEKLDLENTYYSYIQLWGGKYMKVKFHVIHTEKKDDMYYYGAKFYFISPEDIKNIELFLALNKGNFIKDK